MGASEAKRSWPAVSQISNLMVRVGRLHFCVRNAAIERLVSIDLVRYDVGGCWIDIVWRGCVRTSNSRLLVLLEVVVDEAHNERRLEDG